MSLAETKSLNLHQADGDTLSVSYADTYTFTQPTPSASWSVTHNMNKYPSVTIVDSAGNIVEGETIEATPAAILAAGQSQKSIWYKFILPTTRSVRVTMAQPGSAITAGDAGFTVYKTNNDIYTIVLRC